MATFFAVPAATAIAQQDTQAKALAILEKSCAECHRQDASTFSGVEIQDNLEQLLEAQLIVAGDSRNSRLIQVIEKGEMPPPLSPPHIVPPNPKEVTILRQWIDGLNNNDAELRKSNEDIGENTESSPSDRVIYTAEESLLSMSELMNRMESYLRTKPIKSQRSLRFFLFRNIVQLAENREGDRDNALRTAHIALVKALNSLSWNSEPANIEIVPNTAGLVLSVDLESLHDRAGNAWSEVKEWQTILKAYPYGYLLNEPAFEAIQDLTRSGMPVVRADWLITTALQPPLYHDLLQIPENVKELETFLGINVEKNILAGKVVRSGFNHSKVSPHANRLIERHATRDGYYWKSYDFLDTSDPENNKSNIIRFPLGPIFEGNPFTDLAFLHDGGEIIFSLPNGLQGYMLVKRDGTRIDAGPEELVYDFNQVSGTPLIVNGLSCINCHSEGMINAPRDEVLNNSVLAGEVQKFLEKMHQPGVEEFLSRDRKKFLFALRDILEPWQPDSMEVGKLEPVGQIAKQYKVLPLRLREVSAELGVSDERLKGAVEFNPNIQQLGLKVLLSGGVIKRDDWQKPVLGKTKFQRLIGELDLGTPWNQR
jgi:serine/threonine-protein kinase